MTKKTIGVGVIWNQQGQILIDRRRPTGVLGGFWEFPGGKIETGETVEECIKREIWEELGIVIEVGKQGDRLNISRERVRQIEREALTKLRKRKADMDQYLAS